MGASQDTDLEPLDLFAEDDESIEITHIPEAALGKELGRFMRRMRLKAGLKRTEIAGQLGITKGEVQKLEKGVPADDLSFTTVVLFAHVCGYHFMMRIRDRNGQEKETVIEI